MPYSAGTVFLDVVPSFHNVQRKAERAGRDLGDRMARGADGSLNEKLPKAAEEAGDEAGKKYGDAFARQLQQRIKQARRNIGNLEIDVDTDAAMRRVRALEAELEAFADLDIDVEVNGADALREARRLDAEISAILKDETLDVRVATNLGSARQELAELGRYVRAAIGPTKDEYAAAYAEDKRLNDARREEARKTAAERVAEARRAAAAERAAADTEKNMAREVATFRRYTAQAEAAERKRIREIDQKDELEHARTIERERARLRQAIQEQAEAAQLAGRTGTDTDVAAAIAKVKARYEAEERFAEAAANARIRAAAKGLAGEAAAAAMSEQAAEESYNEQKRAAAAAAAARVAIARITAAQERAAYSNTQSAFRQALVANIGQAANSFRLFNGYLLTAVTVGPLLIPILASIAAGMGAISVMALAAVAGIGALIFGLAGIGEAVGAMDRLDAERRKQSSGSGASTPRDTRALRDAQTALARAREDQGLRIADAIERERDAEERLSDALERQRDAQQNLVDARIRAQRQLEDWESSLANNVLDQREAALRLEEAQIRLRNVMEDPQATDREKAEAQLAYDQEVQAIRDLQAENARLTEEIAKANQTGIDGMEDVVDAKERVADANDAVIDAERALADAHADVARARVEEARIMADAEQRVADAMADLEQKSVEAGVAGSAAMDALRESMLKLSPAGQAFAAFLYGLKPLLDEIRFAAQEGLLPGLGEAIRLIVEEYGADFIKFIGAISSVMGNLAVIFAEAMISPEWRKFFEEMARLAPIFLTAFAEISLAFGEFFRDILLAFAPYAVEFAGAFVDIARAMADWAANLSGTEEFAIFLDFVRETGPKVWQILGLIVIILLKMIEGVMPYIDDLADGMIGFLGWLANMDPDTLGKIALSFLAIVAAIQALAGVIAILSSVFGLISGIIDVLAVVGGAGAAAAGGAAAASGPVGWIILAVVAAIAAIIGLIVWIKHLWDTSEEFRAFWQGVWEAIGQIVDVVYNTVIAPVVNAIAWVWENVLSPAWNMVVDQLGKGWEFISGIFNVFWQVVETFGNMFYQIFTFIIAPLFMWLYDNAIKPAWENFIQPVFDAIRGFIEDKIVPAWQRGVEILGSIFDGIREFVAAPIRWVIETVINDGIIGAFNALASKVPGMTPLSPVAIPAALQPGGGSKRNNGPGSHPNVAMAEGGVLPGYTPGRDVHTFVSPTAGLLHLSGGEGILVPELTAMLGRDWIYGANRAARSGGDLSPYLGGRRRRRHFADGGILDSIGDAIGDAWEGATDAVSSVVSDIRGALLNPAPVLKTIVNKLFDVFPGNQTPVMQGLRAIPLALADALGGWISGQQAAAEDQGYDTSGRPTGSWGWMWNVISQAFPNIRLTSAYRPGAITATGVPSMHGVGRAIDLAPPSMDLFGWIKRMYPDSSQLLYSPAGAQQIVWNGRRGDTSGITRAMHFNHVHWAYKDGGIVPKLYDNGGYLPPGLSVVANKTGRPEPILTESQWDALRRMAQQGGAGQTNVNIDTVIGDEEYAEMIAEKIETRRRDAAVLHQLEAIGVGL